MSDQISTFALGTTASVALCLAGVLTAAPAHAATAACRAAKAPRQAFTMRVPFEVIDGRIYIQATVNDRGPFKFAVDTGASGLGRADTSLVSILGLKPGPGTQCGWRQNSRSSDSSHSLHRRRWSVAA